MWCFRHSVAPSPNLIADAGSRGMSLKCDIWPGAEPRPKSLTSKGLDSNETSSSLRCFWVTKQYIQIRLFVATTTRLTHWQILSVAVATQECFHLPKVNCDCFFIYCWSELRGASAVVVARSENDNRKPGHALCVCCRPRCYCCEPTLSIPCQIVSRLPASSRRPRGNEPLSQAVSDTSTKSILPLHTSTLLL